MTEQATETYTERVSDTRAGADWTEVVEFWPADADTADWPTMEVRKLTAAVARLNGIKVGRAYRWKAYHATDGDKSRRFETKGEALAYARKVMAES